MNVAMTPIMEEDIASVDLTVIVLTGKEDASVHATKDTKYMVTVPAQYVMV